jgi:hypothetical protein
MTDYLYACPRRLFGVARLVDLGATFDEYNESSSEPEADARAAFSDWLAVGNDIKAAANQYEQEEETK